MADLPSLLYVGQHGDDVQTNATPSFERTVCADSTSDAVEALKGGTANLTAALFDAAVDSDELEEIVAYLSRTHPEVVVAIAGKIDDEESNRLRLLGVSLELEQIPSEDQIKALAALAARSSRRDHGTDDWSLKVQRGDWVEISVPSKETYVSRVQDLVDMLEKTKLDQDTRDELMLAIDELVRNAIEWGNRFDEDRRVTVSYYCAQDRIVIRVEDEGEGFDHADVADPTLDMEAHTQSREESGKRAGGFGIHLIRNLMDEVLYNEKGNVVMLTKYLDEEEP